MKMLDINAKDILFALGYRNTDINGSILEIAEETAEECRNLMDQQYTDRLIKIDRVENGSVLLESGDALCFAPLAQALSGCSHVVMVLATMGSKIDDKIQSCSSSGDPLKAMMCDAFGTMAILKYQERIQCELVSKLRDSSALPKGLTRGFCPGENGWDLAQQQIVIGLVDAAGIGVSLSSYSIMTPSKTISVVYGIGNGIYEGGHSCDHCTMNACTLRR